MYFCEIIVLLFLMIKVNVSVLLWFTNFSNMGQSLLHQNQVQPIL